MMAALHSLLRPVARLLKPDAVRICGSVIPAKHLRFGGKNFADDLAFLESGEAEARRLIGDFGLDASMSLLEIGCGPGRLPIGLLRTIGEDLHYTGLDVSQPAIDWCKHYIERTHPHYCFAHINVRNDRYNKKGAALTSDSHLPVADASMDAIYLYSVFSHMTLEDVTTYLAEFRRILKPGGRVFFTTFVEENVEPFTVNPEGYRQAWHGALHCVRFEKKFLTELLRTHGLRVTDFHYATETDGQSAVYVTKA